MKKADTQRAKNIRLYFKHYVKITTPNTINHQHDIYIVETNNEKLVFRFSTKECAFRNFYISHKLHSLGINVPDVSVVKIEDEYCEVYPFISGKTLQDRAKEGLSQSQINKIYDAVFDLIFVMAKLPLDGIDAHKNKDISKNRFFKIMNLSKDVLAHTGIHPKNIMLDENDNFCALLDLDAIQEQTLPLTLIETAKNARAYGYNTQKIKELYPEIYENGKMPNIENQIKIYAALEKMKHNASFYLQHLRKRVK